MHYRTQGRLKVPMVIRMPFGGGIGAVEHHSESPESYFAHTAGLKVVACSNPADAYWMIQQAIDCDDPVLFFEPKRRYCEKGEVDTTAAPGPLFASRVAAHRARDVTRRRVRPDGAHVAWTPPRPPRRRGVAGGHRPAHAVAARPRRRCTSRCGAPAGWSW